MLKNQIIRKRETNIYGCQYDLLIWLLQGSHHFKINLIIFDSLVTTSKTEEWH